MPHETLEAIFVQRHEAAADTVARIREGALEGNRPYLLFVGPRGSGKTHFVSLIYHRLMALPELRDKLRIAWLTEDETAADFLDLQLRIFKALSKQYPAEFPVQALQPIYDLRKDAATERLSQLILDGLGARSGLVIVENLDQLFHEIGRVGQQDWRAFLQETGRFAVLATAQQLFPAVSSRNEPFFGTFQTTHLEPLDAELGRQLLRGIAQLQGDQDLLLFLESAKGRARVRALQHLSGGNHRVYVVLSEFIDRESLDQMIGLFEKTLDELTPYYQERLRALSPQQRKIVEHLATRDRPVAVKDIARELFSTNQIISSQLKALKEKRYVRASSRGKESLYELTEPLMRMAMELKEHRGGPIRLVVDFLRVWYDRDRLYDRLGRLPATARLERLHLEEAIRRFDAGEESPCIAAVLDDLEVFRELGDQERELEATEELAETRGNYEDWQRTASARRRAGRLPDAIEAYSRAIEIAGEREDRLAEATFWRGVAKARADDHAGAIADYTTVIELRGAPRDVVVRALVKRGALRGMKRDFPGAIADCTRVIDLEGAKVQSVARALVNRGRARWELKDATGAIADFDRVLALDGAPLDVMLRAYRGRAEARELQGDFGQAIDDYSRLIAAEGAPIRNVALALLARSVARSQIHDPHASDDLTRLIDLPGSPDDLVARALVRRGSSRVAAGDPSGAIEDCSSAIRFGETNPTAEAWARTLRGILKAQRGELNEATEDFTRAVELEAASAGARAAALVQRAIASGMLGDVAAQLADCTRVIELDEVPPESLSRALLIRGSRREASGDLDGALQDFTRVIEMDQAPVDRRAMALIARADARSKLGDSAGELEDCTRLIELPGAPAGPIAHALLRRGSAKHVAGDYDGAHDDCSRAISLEGVRAELIALGHFLRALAHFNRAELPQALGDILDSLRINPSSADAASFHAEILLASGRWDEGWRSLAEALAKFHPQQKIDPRETVRIVFKSTHEAQVWQDRVQKLVRIFADAGALELLADALVRSLRKIAGASVSPSALDDWRRAWRSAGEHHDELALALRMLDVGISYISTRDTKSLLDLPLEQRSILEEVFELPRETEPK